MVARPLCLCLGLLVSFWAGGGAPAGADPLPFSGEVRLALSSTAASYLPIDVGALALRACDPLIKPPDGMAKCHLVVRNPLGGGGDTTAAKGVVVSAGGWPTVMASDLRLASAEAVPTPCGIWDFTLALDPSLTQPESPMVLEESSEDPGSGVFAGVMEMDTILHLENRETGQTADYPLRLGFGLAGPWATAPPDGSPGDVPEVGGLRLFLSHLDDKLIPFEACIPMWVIKSPAELAELVARGCPICWLSATVEQDNHTDDTMD